eukprot:TRINITY_DN14982_c0_g1_i1.p1 TRINITY_DN14982_c0_g1~~TRINITY_DN14982_c0_g1_i1.p1  ORF type:complete len:968 (+),score=212.12 TRINITY_DN14982_c0_g1_i1:120-3023(+)
MLSQSIILLSLISVTQSVHLPNVDKSETSFVEGSAEDVTLFSSKRGRPLASAGDTRPSPSQTEPTTLPNFQQSPARKNPHSGDSWLTWNGASSFPQRWHASATSHNGLWSKKEKEVLSEIRHESQLLTAERESAKRTDASVEQLRSRLAEDSHAMSRERRTKFAFHLGSAEKHDLQKVRKEAMLSKRRAEIATKTLASLRKKHAKMAKRFAQAEANEASIVSIEARWAKQTDERKRLAEEAMERSTLLDMKARSGKAQASRLLKRAHLLLTSTKEEMKSSEAEREAMASSERSAEKKLQTATDMSRRVEAAAAAARSAYKKAQESFRRNLAVQKRQEMKGAKGLKVALKHARSMARQAHDADAKSISLHKKAKELWSQASSVLHSAGTGGTRVRPEREEEPKHRKSISHTEKILSKAKKLATIQKAHVAKAKKIVEKKKRSLSRLLHRHAAFSMASVERLQKAKVKAHVLSQRAEKMSQEAEKLARQAVHDKVTGTELTSGIERRNIDASGKAPKRIHLRAASEERDENLEQAEMEEVEEAMKDLDDGEKRNEKALEKAAVEMPEGEGQLAEAHLKHAHRKKQQRRQRQATRGNSHSKTHHETASTKDDLSATAKGSYSKSHEVAASTKHEKSVTAKSSRSIGHHVQSSSKDGKSGTKGKSTSRSHQETVATMGDQSKTEESKTRDSSGVTTSSRGCHSVSQQDGVTSSQRDQSKSRSSERYESEKGKQTSALDTTVSAKSVQLASDEDAEEYAEAIAEEQAHEMNLQSRTRRNEHPVDKLKSSRDADQRSLGEGASSSDRSRSGQHTYRSWSSANDDDGDGDHQSHENSRRLGDGSGPLVEDARSRSGSSGGEEENDAHVDAIDSLLASAKAEKLWTQAHAKNVQHEISRGPFDMRVAKVEVEKPLREVQVGKIVKTSPHEIVHKTRSQLGLEAVDRLISKAKRVELERKLHEMYAEKLLRRAHST